jgi:hypothetical protein
MRQNATPKRGRPRQFAQRKIVRLDAEMLKAIKRARRGKQTESDVIRAAIAAYCATDPLEAMINAGLRRDQKAAA